MTLQLKAAIAWVIAWTALYFSVATIPDPAGYFGLMVMISCAANLGLQAGEEVNVEFLLTGQITAPCCMGALP